MTVKWSSFIKSLIEVRTHVMSVVGKQVLAGAVSYTVLCMGRSGS